MTEVYKICKARKAKEGLTDDLKLKIGRALLVELLTNSEFDDLMDLVPQNDA